MANFLDVLISVNAFCIGTEIEIFTIWQEIGNLSFDKDDQLAVEFVTAAANVRAASFGIPLHSLFEAKGIAGNIVHAVATTNAIVAGLIVIEAIKVLLKDSDKYRCGSMSFLST